MTLNEQAPAAVAVKAGDSDGHWYTYKDGVWSGLHKEGGTFSLREARKLHAAGEIVVPSVTGIFRMLNKKQITDWLVKGAVLATLKLARAQFDDDDAWAEACAEASQARSNPAKDLGTRGHDAIECAVSGRDYDASMDVYVQPVLQKRGELGLHSMATEIIVGSLEEGYAGRTDDLCKNMIVADYKFRSTKPGRKVSGYETDPMQLSAYGVAHWGQRFLQDGTGINFIVSSNEPGRVEPIIYHADKLRPAYQAFLGLNACWRFANNFDPRRMT